MKTLNEIIKGLETLNDEELCSVITAVNAQKRKNAETAILELVKKIYMGCYVEWTYKGEKMTGKVKRINEQYCRVIDQNGASNMAFFNMITNVSDEPFETEKKVKKSKKTVSEETTEEVSAFDIAM